jgi:hypothetical protein
MVADWFSVAGGASGLGPSVYFWILLLCAGALIPLSIISIFIGVGGFVSDWQEKKRKQEFDDWLEDWIDEGIKICQEFEDLLDEGIELCADAPRMKKERDRKGAGNV